MSESEVYAFGPDGYAKFYGSAHNAISGALSVWKYLEMKYLPSLPMPEWFKIMGRDNYYSRIVKSFTGDESLLKEIWELSNPDSPLSEIERIVLCCTFDTCLVKKEFLPNVIHAYEMFPVDGTNLFEVAQILRKAINDPDVIAVGFSTSLSDNWLDLGLDDPQCPDKILPYNIFNQKEHFFLGEGR